MNFDGVLTEDLKQRYSFLLSRYEKEIGPLREKVRELEKIYNEASLIAKELEERGEINE